MGKSERAVSGHKWVHNRDKTLTEERPSKDVTLELFQAMFEQATRQIDAFERELELVRQDVHALRLRNGQLERRLADMDASAARVLGRLSEVDDAEVKALMGHIDALFEGA